jgi:o-succinylbenzoate synthase
MALSFETFPYTLRLKAPLWTSRGKITSRTGWLLKIQDGDGTRGWGECCPLEGFAPPDRSAAHAYDEAFVDLQARRAGVSVARLLGDGQAAASVAVNALLSEDDPLHAAEEAGRAAASGFRCLKLKVGGRVRVDLERVAAVRRAVGDDLAIRVDANGAWPFEQALQAALGFEALGVELFEQPVAAGAIEDLANLRGRTRVAIAADESVTDLAGARRILEAGAADVLVLKPMRLGGLLPAAAIAQAARAAGAEVVVTSTLEGAIGRAGALHLASALGSTRLAHGLATGAQLAEDLASGLEPKDGRILLPEAPGLGIEPWRQA